MGGKVDDFERKLYTFTNYHCSFFPGLRRRANTLLGLLHRNSISLEDAESRFWELEIALMEAKQQ